MQTLAPDSFCPLTNPQPYQRERDKPRQGVMANTLKSHRKGAVGFIDWLDVWRPPVVASIFNRNLHLIDRARPEPPFRESINGNLIKNWLASGLKHLCVRYGAIWTNKDEANAGTAEMSRTHYGRNLRGGGVNSERLSFG